MEITGWDNVVFTVEEPRTVFDRVVAALGTRWPNAIVFFDTRTGSLPIATLHNEHLPASWGDVIFLRDHLMERHMEKHAYVPMPDGEGPLGFLTSIRRDVTYRCDGLAELKAANKPDFPQVEPYPAWLCSPTITAVTVVTPGDPETNPFCMWACEMVRQACRGQYDMRK